MKSFAVYLGAFAIAVLSACSSPSGTDDGGDVADTSVGIDVRDVSTGTDASDSGNTDAMDVTSAPDATHADVGPHDAQPFSCGSSTCTATQICVTHSGGAIIAPQCMDVPAACGGTPTCDCVCAVGAMFTCSTTDNQTFMCACLTCP